MAQKINNDLIVCGKVAAEVICGNLSDDINRALAKERQAELAEKANVSEVRELAERYNAAIEVINNLSERLAALENNYDPTVIK